MKDTEAASMESYITDFPEEVRKVLQGIRQTIREAVPEAQETIRYKMPTFVLNGTYLIHFAAFKKHIGMYPAPRDPAFEQDFAAFKTSGKGTVQFPLNQPMPLELIRKIALFRAQEIRKA
jgi:uncharacterized protein YdhG (YjbR/CyaY superfamily)